MARLKSKYREKSKPDELQSVELPAIEKQSTELPAAVIAAPVAKDDDATVIAFRAQLAATTQAQSIQKEQAAQALVREQKLEQWKAHGASETDLQYLRANPQFIDRPELLQQQAAQQQAPPAMNYTPEFFRPPTPEPVNESADFVAAPVSRSAPSTANGSYEQPTGRITLSKEEIEAARYAGISTVEYARQKIRLRSEKAQGLRD